MGKHLELTPRLGQIAAWVRPGAHLADVGTDHALSLIHIFMQLGFLTRTPRGRCVTQKAYQHLHLPIPGGMAPEPPDMDQLTL